MRQLPEQCESCKRQIATLETCVLPDGTRKRGVEVTFGESAEGGIRCEVCAGVDSRSLDAREREERIMEETRDLGRLFTRSMRCG